MATRIADAIEFVLQLSLALIGGWVIETAEVPPALTWCAVAIAYLIMRAIRSNGGAGAWLPHSALVRWLRIGFAILASMVGITGALQIIFGESVSEADQVAQAVAVPMVLLAWGVLHFGFADVYRAEQAVAARNGTELPLRFAGQGEAEPSDFVYFAFTVGTTFATSDTEVRTAKVRRMVTRHSVLAFLYNTAILGAAIGLINGN